MKNFDLNFKPKEYFQENGHQIYDLYNEDEEQLTTIAIIEFGCALPFSSFVFLNSYFKDGNYEYKLEDEDQIHSYKIKHNQSKVPLTMGQVIENIDTAILMEEGSISYDEMPIGIIHSFLFKVFKPGDDNKHRNRSISHLRPWLKQKCLKKANELKVVVSRANDFNFAEEQALKVNADCKLYLQPEWSKQSDVLQKIIEYVKNNPKWNISLQTHKYMDVP